MSLILSLSNKEKGENRFGPKEKLTLGQSRKKRENKKPTFLGKTAICTI